MAKEANGPWTRATQRVQDFVAAWAEKHGIDPKQILFKWDVKHGMMLPEHEIEVGQTICILTIYLGKKSQALTFSGPAFSRSHENPEKFLSEYKGQVVAALRRLKRPDRKPAA